MDEHDKDYEKHLQQERIELMRIKQGVQTDAELVVPEEKVKVNYTRKEKRENYFYHYKTTTIVCICAAVLAGIFIYDIATTVHSDLEVMVVTPVAEFYEPKPLEEAMTALATDINGDGKIVVSISSTPINDPTAEGVDPQMYQANFARFAGEMQLNSTLLMVADDSVIKRLDITEVMTDLTALYPENEKVTPLGYYISGTEFAKSMGMEDISDAVFIGVRNIVGKPKEKSQAVYDNSLALLQKIIEQG